MSATLNPLSEHIHPGGAGKGAASQATALPRSRDNQAVLTGNAPARTTPAHTPQQHAALGAVVQVGRFLLHVIEMSIVMVIGMVVFGLLLDQLRAAPSFRAAFRSNSDLYLLGDALFMSVPMVAWMLWRRHDRRHSLEMGAAMFVPALAIIGLSWLGANSYAPWLRDGACGFMCLSMLVYMLLRYDHFSARAGHAAHA